MPYAKFQNFTTSGSSVKELNVAASSSFTHPYHLVTLYPFRCYYKLVKSATKNMLTTYKVQM